MIKRALSIILVLFFAQIGFASETSILDKINSPDDVKKLSKKEMVILAQNIRTGILNRTNLIGGHIGSDLGIVEATIAMHYVFNSPVDKFVFDISHQTYPHKMLTGRKDAFFNPVANPKISGYSNPKESKHDHFVLGHTSTSISLATGLAKARDLKKENYNVIALIGDGSLSGGEAFEGLNNASELNSNFIIIVNDNEMCIAENHGGLYKNLKELRDSNGLAQNNIFKAMGYDYYYVEKGNDITTLIKAFKAVKDTKKPTVVHIHTLKGKGYAPAVENKEKYHWHVAGYMNNDTKTTKKESYVSVTVDYILNKKKEDSSIIAITPATPGLTGFTPEIRAQLGENYTDVGIAEQHAVAYASGIATNGGKPILAISSSFIQRAYDQLSQDLALNNSPAVILVFGGHISNADMTHLGIFDIPFISNIPNIVYLAPTNKEEYIAMLNWAVEQNRHPVAIRVPTTELISTGVKDTTDYSKLNKFKVLSKGEHIAIIAVGNFLELGKEIQKQIKEKFDINATLINPCFLTGIDKELLDKLKNNHSMIITLEDGCLDGGFGEKITRYYANSYVTVLNYGAKKEFTDRVPLEDLYRRYHLTKEQIIEDITEFGRISY